MRRIIRALTPNRAEKKQETKQFDHFQKVKALPQNFAESIIDAEFELENKPSKQVLKKLVELYTIGVEYYDAVGSLKSQGFKKKLENIFQKESVKKMLGNESPQKSKVHKWRKEESNKQEFTADTYKINMILDGEQQKLDKDKGQINQELDRQNKLLTDRLFLRKQNRSASKTRDISPDFGSTKKRVTLEDLQKDVQQKLQEKSPTKIDQLLFENKGKELFNEEYEQNKQDQQQEKEECKQEKGITQQQKQQIQLINTKYQKQIEIIEQQMMNQPKSTLLENVLKKIKNNQAEEIQKILTN